MADEEKDVEDYLAEASLREEIDKLNCLAAILQSIKDDMENFSTGGSKRFTNLESTYFHTNKHMMTLYFKIGMVIERFNDYVEIRKGIEDIGDEISLLNEKSSKRPMGFETSSLIEQDKK